MRPPGRFMWAVGLLLAFARPSFGQSPPKSLAGIALGGLFPAGAFNEHVSQEGYGVGIYYARRAGRGPILVGLDLSYSEYGHVRRPGYVEGFPDLILNVDTTNSIFQGLFFLRLQPRTGRVMTFIEALAGGSYLSTDTTISGGDSDDSYDSKTELDDLTWAAGAGGGLSIRLGKRRVESAEGWMRRSFFEIKVRYLAGGLADYLKKGSIVVDGGEYTITPERSATSVFTVQAGLSWFF